MTNAEQAVPLSTLTSLVTVRGRVRRILEPLTVGLSLLSAMATFVVLAGLTAIVPTHEVVVNLLFLNLVAVLLMLVIIGRETWRIIQARRRGRAAARLHIRIVALFSLIAAVPAILVVLVAGVTLNRGLDQLFSGQTRTVYATSMRVAEAYVNEHSQIARAAVGAMAIDLARAKPLFDSDRERFRQFLNNQATFRGLAAATMFAPDVTVIEQAEKKVEADFVTPSPDGLAAISDSEPQVAAFPDGYIAAVIKLRNFDAAYLFTVQLLDPAVVAQLRATIDGVSDYAGLEEHRVGIQVAFASMYAVIALILVLAAVWIGINFANYLVAPIRRLIAAAQAVSSGNLYIQVPTRSSEGDLGQLGRTFNTMTQDLRTQRDDIVRARDLIDSRRRFTEAVLAGASAGVIGVGADGRITILNRSAEKLIGTDEATALRRPAAEILPELADMLANARSGTQRLAQGQITISRGGRERILSVRVATEQSPEAEHGFVVTLDDISDLVAAQRTSAWADIARRIAHEIKNPLTPIQLSAERLRRKYGPTIKDDPEVFLQCTDTIVRQVDDIKRMVDEFSRFARMPKAVMTSEDVADTVRQAVFLMRVGHPDIDFDVTVAEDPMPAHFDRRLISQALTNTIKNAAEAIGAVPAVELGRGRIQVSAVREGGDIVIDIVDNGIGLPQENRNRLLEPYVTTREKGTGLGLAIVGRILEEHGGSIELDDAAARNPGERGAWVRMRFNGEPVVAAGADEAKLSTVAIR